jgi:hypothetical protein
MLKYTSIEAESSKLSPIPALYVSGQLHTPKPGMGGAMPPVKAKKGGTEGKQPSGADPIYTLETKPSNSEQLSPLERLKQNRLLCLETAETLTQIADYDTSDPIYKTAAKIKNCSLAGAFRSLEPGVNYKIGQALCKSRLCPNCQRVLAAKRRASFMEWFDLNQEALQGYRFYHLVLTVRHSVAKKLRTGVYTSELLTAFANLRGSGKSCNRSRRAWWDERVSGGVFSVELAPGVADSSAHIHLHITLFCAPGTIPIYRADKPSQFVKKASSIWRSLTNDPAGQNVFLEPIYYKTEAGEKQQYKAGEDVQLMRKAVAECMKYTLKSDESSLTNYTADFLRELITTPNRYFGRFGVLSKKTKGSEQFTQLERLNTSFQDLEQIKAKELETLYNPKTGELHSMADTRIALSYFRNTRTKQAPGASIHSVRGETPRGGELYYTFKNLDRVQFLHPDSKGAAALHLARTVRADYQPGLDLAAVPPA